MAGGTNIKYDWVGAFTLFVQGNSLEDIETAMGIPLASLEYRRNADEWEVKARSLSLERPSESLNLAKSESEARFLMIQENRKENYAIACELRENFKRKLVKRLADDSLTVEKLWNNKGEIVRADTEISTGDWVNICTVAQTIANLTCGALGDRAGQGSDGSGGTPNATNSGAPALTIILPGAIAHPRSERGIQGNVIDLREPAQSPVQTPTSIDV